MSYWYIISWWNNILIHWIKCITEICINCFFSIVFTRPFKVMWPVLCSVGWCWLESMMVSVTNVLATFHVCTSYWLPRLLHFQNVSRVIVSLAPCPWSIQKSSFYWADVLYLSICFHPAIVFLNEKPFCKHLFQPDIFEQNITVMMQNQLYRLIKNVLLLFLHFEIILC
jgi:hypothetical protein